MTAVVIMAKRIRRYYHVVFRFCDNRQGARKPAGLTVNTAAAAAVDGAQAPDSSAAGTNDQGPTSMNNLYLPALASHTTDEDLIQLCSK